MLKRIMILGAAFTVAACGNAGSSGDKYVGRWINPHPMTESIDIEKVGDRYKVTRIDMASGAAGGYTASYENGKLVAPSRYGIQLDPKSDSIEVNNFGRVMWFKRAQAPDRNSKTELSRLVEVRKNDNGSAWIDPDIRMGADGITYAWVVLDYSKPVTRPKDNVTYLSLRNYWRISCRENLYQGTYAQFFSKHRLQGEIVAQDDYSSDPLVAPKQALADDIVKRVCGTR